MNVRFRVVLVDGERGQILTICSTKSEAVQAIRDIGKEGITYAIIETFTLTSDDRKPKNG